MGGERRVVVTGMGPATSIGIGIEEFGRAVLRGDSGISFLDGGEFGLIGVAGQTKDFSIKIAGQMKDFDPKQQGIDRREMIRLDRTAQLGIVASGLALYDADIIIDGEVGNVYPSDIDIVLGVGIGGVNTSFGQVDRVFEGKQVSPLTVPRTMVNASASEIGIRYGITGETITTSSACASSGTAIGLAYRLLKWGKKAVCLAGGLESCINKYALLAFDRMGKFSHGGALSHSVDPVYRVYDERSDGFVMGEGCGMLVLEELEHAKRRGARIYAEIASYESTSDAEHIASPDMDGTQLARAVSLALDDAGLSPDDIDYVNSHGTGTINDRIEHKVMRRVFGSRAEMVPVSSTKPQIGHLLGGATAVESIATIYGMYENFIPPLISLESPINGLDYVADGARTGVSLRHTLKFSSGFGGTNIALVFKYEG
jgi:3-oxoacyl-[acyl-carrier-protein] synthase II